MINGVNIVFFLAFVCTGIHAQWIVSKIHENVVPTTESYWVIKGIFFANFNLIIYNLLLR